MDQEAQYQLRQLQQQLAAREQEVAALREIAEAATELQSQDGQAAKVIELSKKNRSMNLLLERERQKVAHLQQAMSELSVGSKGPSAMPKTGDAGNDDAVTKELAMTKDRLQQMTNKMGQLEQKVFLLEVENKKLSRALVREVGDEVPHSKVVDEGSDWKGRREQIIHLKDTIRQLKEAAGAAALASSSLAKHENAHRSVIGKLNKERTDQLVRMAAELEAAKAASEELRLQYAGASSRRKVLEAEVASMKDKLAVVLQKTKNDDRLIAALRAELGAGNRSCGSGSIATGSEVIQLRLACSQLEEQVEQQQKIIRHQQGIAGLSQKAQEELEQLQDENAELRQQLEALHTDLDASRQRPGTSGMSSALRQQVLTLQADNLQLRSQLTEVQTSSGQTPSAGKKPITLHLTESQRLVLEAAKEAVLADDDSSPAPCDAQQAVPADSGDDYEPGHYEPGDTAVEEVTEVELPVTSDATEESGPAV